MLELVPRNIRLTNRGKVSGIQRPPFPEKEEFHKSALQERAKYLVTESNLELPFLLQHVRQVTGAGVFEPPY